jgi:hypothetical protein
MTYQSKPQITVGQLIELLKQQPQDKLVWLESEDGLSQANDVYVNGEDVVIAMRYIQIEKALGL